MKKLVLIIVALAFVFTAQTALAGPKPNGQPFQEIWKALENRINAFQDGIKILKKKMRALETRLKAVEEQADSFVPRMEMEAKLADFEARLSACGCEQTPELGECTGEEANTIGSCQIHCDPSISICLDDCADGLSDECQTVYQAYRACTVEHCPFIFQGQEDLFGCAEERCPDLYEAVYGNYVEPVCGDGICNGGETNWTCAADCPPEYVACGIGACGTTVPYGQECVPLPPSDEVCDGVDNDCDGFVDNGFAIDQECEAEEGRSGYTACSPDGLGIICQSY